MDLERENTVAHIFNMRMVIIKMLAKDKKVCAAFMDLGKAYDRVDWDTVWDVLKIYGVGGRLLDGVKIFYRDASACVLKRRIRLIFKNKSSVRFVRGELKANVGKSKVRVFEERRREVIEFVGQYRMRAESQKECKVRMNGQIAEDIN